MTSRLTRVGAFFVFAAASTHTVDEALQGLAAAHGNVHVVTRNSNLLDIQAFLACKGVSAAVHCVPRSSGRSKADVILALLPEPAVGVFVDDRCSLCVCIGALYVYVYISIYQLPSASLLMIGAIYLYVYVYISIYQPMYTYICM